MSQLSGAMYPAWQRSPYLEPWQPRWLDSFAGPLEMVTPPSGLCLSVAEAKLQCKQDNTADDNLIAALILAAQEWCERNIEGGRQLLAAQFDCPLLNFWPGVLKLPLPPLKAVVSVSYYDTGGTLQLLDASVYFVRQPWRQPGTIERATRQVWPVVQGDRRFPVVVRLVAGYGPNTTVAGNISAGAQTVTPASMFGIYPNTQLIVDTAAAQETILVTAVTATTFTATFARAHTAPVAVYPGLPPTIRQAVLMVVAHWYKQREPVGQVSGEVAMAVTSLLAVNGYGSYA